ncbi:MAG: hypothetical protein JO297_07085 [Nitrososphaeraceae archaeon]|nr:hypothetical protein [Nitrososphaeraceae archaeon]
MDTLQDPNETQEILVNLFKSATEEIPVILPTITNTDYQNEYLLQALKNKVRWA